MGKLVEDFKSTLNRYNNRNFKFVKVKSDRHCRYCGERIPAGQECLTINKRYKGRSWECTTCVSLKLQVMDAKALCNAVPFDDEGADMACSEYLDEVISRLEERKV